jgi:hypothetical protein
MSVRASPSTSTSAATIPPSFQSTPTCGTAIPAASRSSSVNANDPGPALPLISAFGLSELCPAHQCAISAR